MRKRRALDIIENPCPSLLLLQCTFSITSHLKKVSLVLSREREERFCVV
jgi:hypothetical protein